MKYRITYKYVYEIEVEADDGIMALGIGEELMVKFEAEGLGSPDRIEEEINKVMD